MALVVWKDGDFIEGHRIAAARFEPTDGWSEVVTLYQGRSPEELSPPQLAVDRSGNAVVVFSSSVQPTNEVLIHSVRYRAP